MAEYIERTEELGLAMNAGARAIENTRRYHGAVYSKNVFSEDSQEIPYLLAAKVLREVSDAPTVDAVPVVHGRWEPHDRVFGDNFLVCSKCQFVSEDKATRRYYHYCPNCGAMMDGGQCE